MEIVEQLLEKKPNDRFQSASEVADLLQEALADRQRPTSLQARPRKSKRYSSSSNRSPVRRTVLWGVAFAAIIAGAILAGRRLPLSPSSPVRAEDHLKRIAACDDPEQRKLLIARAAEACGGSMTHWQGILEGLVHDRQQEEGLAIAAYDVCRYLGSQWGVGAEFGDTCRDNARYRLAIQVFADHYDRYNAKGDFEGAGWVQFRWMRLYSELHDYDNAELCARESLRSASRPAPPNERTLGTFKAGISNVVGQIEGRDDECRSLASEVVAGMEDYWKQNPESRVPDAELFYDEYKLISGMDVNAQAIIDRLPDAMKQSDPMVAYVAGLAHQRLGQLDRALELYEYAARNRSFNVYGGMGTERRIEERLLRVLLDRGDADRAVAIFSDLVAIAIKNSSGTAQPSHSHDCDWWRRCSHNENIRHTLIVYSTKRRRSSRSMISFRHMSTSGSHDCAGSRKAIGLRISNTEPLTWPGPLPPPPRTARPVPEPSGGSPSHCSDCRSERL